MTYKNIDFNEISKLFNKKLMMIGASILFVELIYHILFLDYLFSERDPLFSTQYVVENIVIFIGVAIIFWALIRGKQFHITLFRPNYKGFEFYCIIITLIFSILFVLFFIFNPKQFSLSSKEDNIIEWLSTLFLFTSSIVFIIASVKLKRSIASSKMNQMIFYFFAFIFFVLAMEEISWFQRVFEVEVTDKSIFKYNRQNETNLHNFATNISENIFYFGSFIALVFLPFIGLLFKPLFEKTQISLFIPRPYIAIIGSLFCSYNYDMWNVVFIQYSFFCAVIILYCYSFFCTLKSEKALLYFSLLVLIFSQFIFLFYGENYKRIWEVTEYKEFLIAFGFLIYSIDLIIKISLKESKTSINEA